MTTLAKTFFTRPLHRAVLVVLAAQMFDWSTFMVGFTRHGISDEMNPIVIALANKGGMILVSLAKFGLILFACSIALYVAPKYPLVARLLILVGVFAGIIGGISNGAFLV